MQQMIRSSKLTIDLKFFSMESICHLAHEKFLLADLVQIQKWVCFVELLLVVSMCLKLCIFCRASLRIFC